MQHWHLAVIACAISFGLVCSAIAADPIPSMYTLSNPPSGPGKAPESLTVKVGETATFTVEDTIVGLPKTPPPAFQWYKNYRAPALIPGATNSSYTTPPTTLADNNTTYVCYVDGQPLGGYGGLITYSWLQVYAEGEKTLDWVKVTEHAEWSDRDSLQPLVFNNKMWIFEGWRGTGNMTADVWNTADGKTWSFVIPQGPWQDTDMHSTVVFDNKIWLMGGTHLDGTDSNAVYWSADGAHWEQATAHAAWSPRSAASVVAFKGKMWLFGGGGKQGGIDAQIWSSTDGVKWDLATDKPGWEKRMDHKTVELNGKLYLYGGRGTNKFYNDVWSSEDGVTWTKLTDAAAWTPRIWFGAVAYRGRMWIVGGESGAQFNDVWHSTDGITWKQLKSKVVWRHKHGHGLCVFQDKIFIFGGSDFRWCHPQPDNDMWSLEVPEGFFDK